MTELSKRERDVIDAVRDQVSMHLRGQGAGHGFDHVTRVHRTACRLQKEAGGERFTIELAAWLHDVGDAKFNDGQELSGKLSREILTKLDVDATVIESVVDIVDKISFRKQTPVHQLSHEARIVQDADRLDALGAVGIVRTIEFGAVKNQPFHDSSASQTGLGHFFDKLFKLRELMNTDAAKAEAASRERIMRDFVRNYVSECGIDDKRFYVGSDAPGRNATNAIGFR